MRILQIVFFLRVCWCLQPINVDISDILEITKLSKNVTYHVRKMMYLLDKDVGLSQKVKDQKDLLKEMKVINNKIDMLNMQMSGSQLLKEIVSYTYVQSQLKDGLMEADKNIDFISSKYKYMVVTFIESKTAFKDVTLEEFARSIVSPSNSSVQSVLDRIHAIIAPRKDEDDSVDGVPSIFKILIQNMREEGNKMFCNTQTSAQQFILYLYNTLALTELKGFLMIEFSYMLLKLHNQGDFPNEIKAKMHSYNNRSGKTLKMTIEAVQTAPTEFWKCDPYKQVKNETYIEITQFLQGYIENEKNLYELNRMRSCYHDCKPPSPLRVYECTDDDKPFCRNNRKCDGNIINCSLMKEGRVCLADAGTNRRYEYISTNEIVGRWKSNCPEVEIKSWIFGWQWLTWCQYCMCFCDGGTNSEKMFNLRSSESDIDQNMVVTGLRFVKNNRIIHLQIQEGKLLPSAQIDVATVHWKPVDNYTIVLYSTEVLVDKDYYYLSAYEPGFDLDDLVAAKDDELVTGVRFTIMDSHLHFEIRVTGFNFRNGTLKVGNSTWLQNGGKNRKKINLDNKNIPITSPGPSHRVSESGMYLDFTHSDFRMDAAQTAVPFIDAQPVASAALPVPLRGAGVMYKGFKNYGGFINLKIMTYDYSNVLLNSYDNTNYDYEYL